MTGITAFFTAVVAFFTGIFGSLGTAVYKVDAGKLGEKLDNVASNVNTWDMGTQFYSSKINEKDNIYDFVEYIQLMQCSGGNLSRDLFVDPSDRQTLDDYDFSRLIKNCAGILSLGAKPHLKLGSVPVKYSSKQLGDEVFGCNVYPPDDYGVYYDYIAALAGALVESFGREEVLTWRFGVMTEYENAAWFQAVDGKPESTAKEFCKLYDCTVKALTDVIGPEVYVGAHSMTVTEGLWDEEIFIRHCAREDNYFTGGKGTRLCYLSSSFYDVSPGKYTKGMRPAECINYLRKTAEKYDLKDLKFGFDEGRILYGTAGRDSEEINSRTVGYTWQGAYDTKLYAEIMRAGASYFSSWSYFTRGLSEGVPNITYHAARLVSEYKCSRTAEVKRAWRGLPLGGERNVFAAYDTDAQTLRLMTYNFKNSLDFDKNAKMKIKITLPDELAGKVKVTIYPLDDNCNFFDEWKKDCEGNNITPDCFHWSPDDGNLGTLFDPAARQFYDENEERYMAASRLTPEIVQCETDGNRLELERVLPGNTACWYVIEKVTE